MGVQGEVLASLALVMGLAALVLAAVLVIHGEARLRDWLGRALLAEARAPGPAGVVPGTRWWTLSARGEAQAHGPGGAAPDPASRRLAEQARRAGRALLRPGALWEPVRFAAPVGGGGEVAVALLPSAASLRLRGAPLATAALVLLVDVGLFTAFGAYLLRRRVVQPLQSLAAAAAALAEREGAPRVRPAGALETWELAEAFNATSDALSRRTGALEKAVADLRAANAELRRARAGLDRAERLASVGRLAAGVAHEVGNPISALMAFLDLVGRDPRLSPASRSHLERAGREAERVRRILRQLLDFSRPARGVPAPVDVAALARETVALVEAQRRYAQVALSVHEEPGTPPAWADASALTQVLLNLVLNAADAALESPAPRVELRVGPAPLAARRGETLEAARARRQAEAVACSVADNGRGIPEEDRERIFDPFFTTKPAGEGTGLGLSNALRLAEEQGGSLELAEPPAGLATAFLVRLPAASAGGEEAAAACVERKDLRGAAADRGPDRP
jgi:hypothetical protein